jgi:hypothetical protein
MCAKYIIRAKQDVFLKYKWPQEWQIPLTAMPTLKFLKSTMYRSNAYCYNLQRQITCNITKSGHEPWKGLITSKIHMKYPSTYHSKDITKVKVFGGWQNRMTELQNERQDKKQYPPPLGSLITEAQSDGYSLFDSIVTLRTRFFPSNFLAHLSWKRVFLLAW